jgi:alpha-D-ribose 1-methylphosphonate 5-triphosphate diphosphatase PhnM
MTTYDILTLKPVAGVTRPISKLISISDHAPVFVRFIHQSKYTKSANLPIWIAKCPAYVPRLEAFIEQSKGLSQCPVEACSEATSAMEC